MGMTFVGKLTSCEYSVLVVGKARRSPQSRFKQDSPSAMSCVILRMYGEVSLISSSV